MYDIKITQHLKPGRLEWNFGHVQIYDNNRDEGLLQATVDHEPWRPLISSTVARQRPRMFDKELLAMLREQYVSCVDRPRSPARRRPRGTGAAAPRPLEPGGRSHDRWRRGGKLQRRRRRRRLSGPLPLQQALPPSGVWSEVVFQDDRESLSRLQVDMFRTVQELLQFDEAADDYDGRPLITMRCRAASLREPVSSTTARR